ncbi:hypothetical protein PC129_g22874, partial [Phytophthora cactorum]
MATTVELNKNGCPVNWQGQCWTYYKRMMEFSVADKEVLEYAKGEVTLASGASDVDTKMFNNTQMKVDHIIMALLSMELGQQVMIKANGTEMWKYLEDTNLLSNSQIEDQGYSVEYHGRSGANVYEVWKGSEKLFEVAPD